MSGKNSKKKVTNLPRKEMTPRKSEAVKGGQKLAAPSSPLYAKSWPQ